MDLFFNLYKIKFTLLDELLNNVEIDKKISNSSFKKKLPSNVNVFNQ